MPSLTSTPADGFRRAFALTTLVVAGALPACKSASDQRLDADREVYEIVQARRDELAAGGSFSIDPPTDSLRKRLLSGEAGLEPLQLVECLSVAAENSRDYQTQREQLYLAALDLTLERWNFSVQQTGTFGAFLAGRGGDAESAGVLSNLGLTRLLGTGLRLVGNIGLDLVRDVSTGDGWDAVSNLSLNVTQPLMRGFGRRIVQEPLTQAERTVLYQARSYERFRRTFAFDVASRFFRILVQVDTLSNEEANYESLSKLRERNEAFAEAGLLTDIQVDQARQDELRAENRVIEATRDLQSALDDFKLFLGLPIETPLTLDAGDDQSLEAWQSLELEIAEARAVEVALASRLDFLTSQDRVVDAGRRARVAADALRAGLDISVSGAATSSEGRPLDFDDSAFLWDVDLTFDAPWNRLPERNTYRAALITLQAARRRAEQDADTIRADLRDSLRRLQAARAGYEIQSGAVVLAQRRVESTELNLEAGRASTRDVLEAQEDLLAANNAETSALADYILSGLALFRDMELLRVSEEGLSIETEPLLASAESEEMNP